jgi:hypothetical protein
MDRRAEPLRTDRFERKKKDVSLRLRAVCKNMSPEEFDALVERIVLVDMKYATRRENLLERSTKRSQESE